MALFKTSALFSEISGSVGSVSFRNSPGSIVGYSRPGCRRIISPNLSEHQMFMAQACKDWNALTDDLKKFWKYAARQNVAAGGVDTGAHLTPRQYYFAWRLRCLHAHAESSYDTQPTMPIYWRKSPRVEFFSAGLSTQFYAQNAGSVPPFPRGACWVSWPPNGTQKPGRIWRKFWPVPGHETARQGVDLDQVFFERVGIPPELRPYQTMSAPQVVAPLVRTYSVYATGRIEIAPVFSAVQPTGLYRFEVPPDTAVYT